MSRSGYSPYCGNDNKCAGRWPRTKFNGSQFVCKSCGWISNFDEEFINRYINKWSSPKQNTTDKVQKPNE